MRVLAVFVPLAVALVLIMATFLCLEPLIYLAGLELRTWLLTWHASHSLLRHLLLHLLLHELLLLARHGHLLLRLLLLGVSDHLLLTGIGPYGHGHLWSAHGLRHRCFKLLLSLVWH